MKKLMIRISAAAALSLLAACGGTASDYERLSEGYSDAADAVKIEKVVEVQSGGIELSKVTETYQKAETGYTVTVTARELNEIGQGEGMYSETTETSTAASVTMGAFPEENDLLGAAYTTSDESLSLSASLATAYMTELGIPADGYKGVAAFSSRLQGDEFVYMSIEYVSSNGNNVSITFTFEY